MPDLPPPACPPYPLHHIVIFWADRHLHLQWERGVPWTGTNIVESLRYSVWTLKSIKWQIEFRQKMAIGGHKNYMSFCRELQSTRHQRECQFNNCSNNNNNNNKGNNSKRKQKTTKITKRREAEEGAAACSRQGGPLCTVCPGWQINTTMLAH